MSEPQQPPPQQPPLPIAYAYPEPSLRPTSVTVMAIIGIILGAMGFLCLPLSLIPYFMPMPVPNPVIDGVKNDSFLFGTMIAGIVMGWLLGALLLVGSIAALTL